MDANLLYSYLYDMDWFFLVTCALLVTAAAMIVFEKDIWPDRSDETRNLAAK